MRNTHFFLSVLVAVFLFDQLTKLAARQLLSQQVTVIKNFFVIGYSSNTGALFGLFKGNASVLAWLGLIAAGLLLYFYKEVESKKLPQLFYALVLGGVFGNLVDRFFFGAVTDFLDFAFWPAFNFADIAATIGVFGLLAYYVKKKLISSS
jgi:signal peptidase II